MPALTSKTYPIDLEHFEELVEKYSNLITAQIAKCRTRFNNDTKIEWDDLHQNALLAMWKSILHYKPEKGTQFGHYLKTAIENQLSYYCRGWVPGYSASDGINENGSYRNHKVYVKVESLEALTPYGGK